MTSFRSVINYNKDDSLCIKVIGYRQSFKNDVHAPTGTNDYFLFLLPRDSWCVLQGKKTFLDKSALLLQPPGAGIHHGKESGMIRSWIRFGGDVIDSLCRLSGIKLNSLYEIDNPREHEGYLLELYREIHHPKGPLPANVKNLLSNWFRSIVRDAADHYEQTDNRLIQVREYMEQNYAGKLELEDLCRHSGLSRNDLCRLFKSSYRTSPIQYLISLRISLARELLTGSRLPLKTVAEQSGFSDQYYFSRCFKKHTGTTPGQFRDSASSSPDL